ncbi:MAG: hypothetical protein IT320_12245 [Anaerolineae bacterium]|nr:hypothetical protein [Anaerolineae bacterium]
MKTILVQMANRRWTTQALHLACALARNDQASVVLLRLMQVDRIRDLGSEFGDIAISRAEYRDLLDYSATAEDYGVDISLEQMQCISPLQAVADAAGYLSADVVFARVPESHIPLLRSFQIWQLERRLAPAHRQLYTLDGHDKDGSQMPAITVKPAHSATGR